MVDDPIAEVGVSDVEVVVALVGPGLEALVVIGAAGVGPTPVVQPTSNAPSCLLYTSRCV